MYLALAVAGCRGPAGSKPDASPPLAPSSAGVEVAFDAAPSRAPSPCRVDPPGGVVVSTRPSSRDVRVAAAGRHALVTWLEAPRAEGRGFRSVARLYDGDAHSLAKERILDDPEYGDEVASGAVPFALPDALVAVSCRNAASEGSYGCVKAPFDSAAEPTAKNLFYFKFGNFGPQEPGIAGVALGTDLAIFVPEGGAGDVALFTTRVRPTKRTFTFVASVNVAPHAEGLVAVATGDDEATVVYRLAGAIRARRGGLDEAWHGKTVVLSEPGTLVGAPAVAAIDGRLVALHASRKTASDIWKLTRAEWKGDAVTRGELATGSGQAQAPALVAAQKAGCLLVSWVDGRGTETLTKVGRMCDGHLDPATVGSLSQAGIEGGRAALGRSAEAVFAVWQELPKGHPAELRIGRLSCE